MTTAMYRRGPDGIDHWRSGNVAFGQCMLRTTPESLEETQPLSSEDESLVLVMDGRVDNGEELRHALLGKGAVLRTRTDAELVLRAYEVWGEECADRIIGEFVFLVWDARHRRLFGSRDAAGARHFYYYQGHRWLAFASEIKGLLALPQIRPTLNECRLLDYLVPEFDRDDEVNTFYAGIFRLPAGHAIRASAAGTGTWRYWQPESVPSARVTSHAECAEALLTQIQVATKARLRAVGPVAAMLSGGLDSSMIVGLISGEFRASLTQPLTTVSLIRDDRDNCRDWPFIQEMLRDTWLDPVVITPALPSDRCDSFLNDAAQADEPFSPVHGFTDALVYEGARSHGCRIVLDGMAGDLLFLSPERSLSWIVQAKKYSLLPDLLSAYRYHGIKNGRLKIAWQMLRSMAPQPALNVYRAARDAARALGVARNDGSNLGLSLLRPAVRRQLLARKATARVIGGPQNEYACGPHAHARNFTTGLLSFAHEVIGQPALAMGVEPRSPFSDRRVIECAVSLPAEAKLCAPRYKQLLRECAVGVLPESVRQRPVIGGHPGWKFFDRVVTQTEPRWSILTTQSLAHGRLAEWIDVRRLSKTLADYQTQRSYDTGYGLLRVAVLALWLQSRSL